MTDTFYRDDDDKGISKPIPKIIDAKHLTSLTSFWVFLKANESNDVFSAVYAEFSEQKGSSLAHAIQVYLAVKAKFVRMNDDFNDKWTGGKNGE
jgi:hypothetical protein